MDVYKSLNISIGTVMKNPEMLKLVLDYLKTKIMCKYAARKLPYLLKYVPGQYKTQEMCDKAIPENGGTLSMFLTAAKIKKCVMKQSKVTLKILFVNAIRLTNFLLKLLILILLQQNLFLTAL